MRSLIVTLLIVPFGLLYACRPELTQPQNNEFLLEVITEASETMAPPGRSLDMLVHENGVVEFDYFPIKDLSGSEFPAPKRLETVLLPEELAELRSALKSLEVESPDSVYAPTIEKTIDEWLSISIRFRSESGIRSIVIKENDTRLHLNAEMGKYPPSIVRILRFNYSVGSRIRKEVKD